MGISLFRGKEHRMKRLILLLATMATAMVMALMMVAISEPRKCVEAKTLASSRWALK
jgi:hypothetical protein